MSTTKRIIGNYTLTNKETAGANVIISTGTLFIDGNLQIGGNSQSISHTNTDITDNIIILNKGETSAGVSSPYVSGLQIDRGSLTNVSLRWNDSPGYQKWQITTDGTTYSNIAVTTATGGATIAANLDMLSYSIYSSTNGNVCFNDNVAIQNTTVAPPAQAGYNILYTQTPSGGGSGLYVTNTTTTAQELATKAAAIKYSIIFG